MKNTYKNRYNDIFTFTRDENHDILWEGDFKYCRIGMPNDYTTAYDAYCNDRKGPMSLEHFKKAVHEWDDETSRHYYPEYVKMVESLPNEISMVDPSGGCYLSSGMSLDFLGFNNCIIEKFEPIPTGYKIIIKK